MENREFCHGAIVVGILKGQIELETNPRIDVLS